MIWSFVKIVVFIAMAAALAWGASYVIDTAGSVHVTFGAREWTFPPLMVIGMLVAAFVALFLLMKVAGFVVALLRFVNGDDTALSRYFDRNREKKGYKALSDSMVALAEGDGRRAANLASRAERYLDQPEYTRLISAQAAELSGQADKAQDHYKALVTNDATRFAGVQGLLRQKLEEGDTDRALKLAEKAFALRPEHQSTLETLFRLQSEANDWGGARQTLQAKVYAKQLPKDIGRRQEGVLALADAIAAKQDGEDEKALDAVLKALKSVPALVPAADLAARLLTEKGETRRATTIIKKAWSAAPHPDLAAAYAAIEPDESASARLSRFKGLLKAHPDHAETKLLDAELNLAIEDFPAARKAIGDLAETDPTTRSLAIMAAVERGSGASEAVVSGWLAKALGASRGDTWICESCKTAAAHWGPLCENCGGFDTLTWQRAPHSESDASVAAAMLPLMMAAQEEPAPAEEPADEVVEHEEAPKTETENAT